MFYIKKRIEISFAHRLDLPYESKCTRLHGHNAIIEVYCRASELNAEGMVIDFKHVKEIVKKELDHRCLNDLVTFNPTAEQMARWICERVPGCYKVSFQESEGNTAVYVLDDALNAPL